MTELKTFVMSSWWSVLSWLILPPFLLFHLVLVLFASDLRDRRARFTRRDEPETMRDVSDRLLSEAY